MTLAALRYIASVAREQHFERAAKARHVSQTAHSVAIKISRQNPVSLQRNIVNKGV